MEKTDEVVSQSNCVWLELGGKGRSNKLYVEHFLKEYLVVSVISSFFLARS
jgi:hypothetical protein